MFEELELMNFKQFILQIKEAPLATQYAQVFLDLLTVTIVQSGTKLSRSIATSTALHSAPSLTSNCKHSYNTDRCSIIHIDFGFTSQY